jgi:DNA-binding XRE family transcriptional regulator
MASGYREDRRIDAIRPLSAVTKNEAAEATDLRREKAIELERERLADQLRAEKPKRSFADLLKKKP